MGSVSPVHRWARRVGTITGTVSPFDTFMGLPRAPGPGYLAHEA